MALYSSSVIEYEVQLSAAVLYDYFLTLPLELSLIWSGKLNVTKALFFLNRYASLISECNQIIFYSIKPASRIECRAFSYLNQICNALTAVATYSIFTLRTFAIYGRNWTVFFVLAIPALVDVASSIWGAIAEPASALHRQLQNGAKKCTINSSSSGIGPVINSISTTVFDALVVVLTVYRTVRLAKQSKVVGIRRSLSFILLRDGLAFYAAIFVPIIVKDILNAMILKDGGANISYISDDFTFIVEWIRIVAVNRLVLSLCYAGNVREGSEYSTQTTVSALNSTLGNIGGLVCSIPDDFHEDFVRNEGGTNDTDHNIQFEDDTAGSAGVDRKLDSSIVSHSSSKVQAEEV